MCLAIPLKIISVDGNTAIGEAMGMQREMRVDFIPDPKPGDYVIVHAGFAIERLPEQQAMEDLEAWEDVRDAVGWACEEDPRGDLGTAAAGSVPDGSVRHAHDGNR